MSEAVSTPSLQTRLAINLADHVRPVQVERHILGFTVTVPEGTDTTGLPKHFEGSPIEYVVGDPLKGWQSRHPYEVKEKDE